MYSVYGDGVCIYDDVHIESIINAINPILNMSNNTAGTLEITLPVGNAGYDILKRLSSEIIIKRYDEEIWAGRIIKEKKNFQNSRVLTCEGELTYFNDTTQPPTEYEDVTVYEFLSAVLEKHNLRSGYVLLSTEPENWSVSYSNYYELQNGEYVLLTAYHAWQPIYYEKVIMPENKRFELGIVGFNGDYTLNAITNNETTLEAINKHLVDKFGGHIRIRHEYDANNILHKKVDYLKEYPSTNNQEIRFGKNLLDFTKNWDMSNYATVVMAKGARLSDSPIESIDAYLDVSEVNGGSRYVTNEEGIKEFGWIEVVVEWEDTDEASELKQKAKDYLENEQFDGMVIEISAVDLRYLTDKVQPISLLDSVRCVSNPHGMDRTFPVTELKIQLDKPENSTYTLGGKVKNNTLTSSTRAANEEILDRIAKIPNEQSILDRAKENATAIMNMATTGYVTITKNQEGSDKYSESIIISDTRTITSQTKMWKWNQNGLAYSSDGGQTFVGPAITKDGSIVADYITTGTMSANRIRTGLLKSQDGNVVWNLNSNNVSYVLTEALPNNWNSDYSNYYELINGTYVRLSSYKDWESDKYYEKLSTPYYGGSLTIKKGSITLGYDNDSEMYNFSVDNTGVMIARKGNIGGFTIDSYDIHNDTITLDSYGLRFSKFVSPNRIEEIGYFGTQYWNLNPKKLGIVMNLNPSTDDNSTIDNYKFSYIGWFRKESMSADVSEMKLMYTAHDLTSSGPVNESTLMPGDRLYFGCDSDFRKHMVYNCVLDPNTSSVNGGPNGRVYFWLLGSSNMSFRKGYLEFQNGFIKHGYFPNPEGDYSF